MTKDEFLLYIIRTLILEYRLSFDSVDELFNIDSERIYNDIINCSNITISRALEYVLKHETVGSLVDQNKSKKKAIGFLKEFKKCKTSQEKVEMLNNLNNSSLVNKIKTKKAENINPEDKKSVIKYRYRHCLTLTDTCNLFNITRRTLRTWENNLEDELFIQKLKSLNDYHQSFFDLNSKIR